MLKKKQTAAIQYGVQKPKEPIGVRLKREITKNWILYLMLLPVLAYFVIFKYMPMYGITIAFKDFSVKKGILGSPWIGFDNFERFFSVYNFKSLLWNTLRLSLYSLVVGFPIPIVFALFLNYLRSNRLRKAVQMVSYAPHFLSTVVVCSILTIFMSKSNGIINILIEKIGLESIDFLGTPEYFSSIYVWSGVWQNMGWNAIIYISALAGVDQQMHEAAIIDGATKLQRMWYIDLPSIKSTIVMLLIMRMGSIMDVGFEKVFLLQNSLNLKTSEIVSTYVYQVGLSASGTSDFSYATAIGCFNSVVNLILICSVNKIASKYSETSLW